MLRWNGDDQKEKEGNQKEMSVQGSEYCYTWTLLGGDLSRKEKKDTEGSREIRLLR